MVEEEKISVDFEDEAKNMLKIIEKRNITLRLMGGVAIRLHCPKFRYLHLALERRLTDLDFMGYGKQWQEIAKMFKDLHFVEQVPVDLKLMGLTRFVFYNPIKGYVTDVFLDELKMCHTIDFRKRLEIDNLTISLSDLLLAKMQIVHLSEKDVKDTIVLLREHDVGEMDDETINCKYISKLLCKDWGFYYTMTTNLKRIRDEFLSAYDILKKEDRTDVSAKIDKLLECIEKEPKSFKWKLCAKIGTKRKGYREVEEVQR